MARHLLETKDFKKDEVEQLLDLAQSYLDSDNTLTSKNSLSGHIIITAFFENSTRTLSSFEVATKHLGGEVVRLDVSRSSEFVVELANRLSNVSGKKPTRSDLVTFAKREGLDCKSDSYKSFISDVEDNAVAANDEIIKPLEDLIIYAGI